MCVCWGGGEKWDVAHKFYINFMHIDQPISGRLMQLAVFVILVEMTHSSHHNHRQSSWGTKRDVYVYFLAYLVLKKKIKTLH